MTKKHGRAEIRFKLEHDLYDAAEEAFREAGLSIETGLTELEASKLLPADSRAYADGSKFDAVWSSACAWPSATFFLEHLGNVIEVSCKLAEGKHGMGYYNIFHGSPLGGHLKADAVKTIGFITLPFMGRESHFLAFFNEEGESMFQVYVGRENHQLIPEARDAFLALKAELGAA